MGKEVGRQLDSVVELAELLENFERPEPAWIRFKEGKGMRGDVDKVPDAERNGAGMALVVLRLLFCLRSHDATFRRVQDEMHQMKVRF